MAIAFLVIVSLPLIIVGVYVSGIGWNKGPFYALLETSEYPKPTNKYLMEHGVMFNDWGRDITKDVRSSSWPAILSEITHFAWCEEEYDIIYLKTRYGENFYRFHIITHELKTLSEEEFIHLGLSWYPAFRSAAH